MKKYLLKSAMIAGVLALSLQADAQQNKSNNFSNVIQVNKGSFFYRAAANTITQADAVNNLAQMLGLGNQFTFAKLYERTDKLGFTQSGYQQYFKGVVVDGGMVLLHSKNGYVQSINGNIAATLDVAVVPAISKKAALSNAKNAVSVRKTIKDYAVDLVIMPTVAGRQDKYVLAFKTRIDGKNNEGKMVMKQVYVDATTGTIIKQINLIKTVDKIGSAATLYSGTQSITCDSSATGFTLHDNARKIITYDAGGADMDMTGTGPYFSNPREFTNTTSDWAAKPALMQMKLTGVSNNMLTGLGFSTGYFVSAFVAKDYGAGMALSNWPDINFYSTSLPQTTRNVYVFPTDNSYVGMFGKIDLGVPLGSGTLDVSDTAFVNVTNIAPGVHTWTDLQGNTGTYTIQSVQNPALDAHWGMEKTHDFYNQILNRNSYDGNGSEVVNYVNGIWPTSLTQDNAAALPSPYFSMVYGMGDGTDYDAFVGLDVMGHEFTHMVTESNGNGGLDYEGESGALNESFSDVFGTSIEFFTNGASANWTIGEDLAYDGTALRSMATPKQYHDPDTYEGQYWKNPANLNDGDNGGVHSNSGVQNKWFYLLSVGGSGTNDKGDAYTVTGIGIEKAQKIAYRSLTTYIVPTSQYIDAYEGSKQAAIDLYGADTTKQEYKSVKDAWYAVGIGEKDSSGTTAINNIHVADNDLQLYPNPASTNITINSALAQNVDAEIVNVLGVSVMKIAVKKGLNTFNISNLAKGIYMVRYNTGAQGYVQKFAIQ